MASFQLVTVLLRGFRASFGVCVGAELFCRNAANYNLNLIRHQDPECITLYTSNNGNQQRVQSLPFRCSINF